LLGFRQCSNSPKLLLEDSLLRRLFSTFARGWPGVGLLLLRLVLGTGLIWRAVESLNSNLSFQLAALLLLLIGLGLLLIIGLWTPMTGTLVAVLQLYRIASNVGDAWTCILLATIGAALALLGPGFWSLDARIFGWKRIEPTSPEA
jgi:putative oxidoreductase